MDKSLILNEIKNIENIKTDKAFADFLGVKPTALAMWYKRNSFDIELVFKKCEYLNPEWLLTGKGPILKENTESDYQQKSKPIHVNESAPIYNKADAPCEEIIKENYQLRNENKTLMQQNSALKDDKIALIQEISDLKVKNGALAHSLEIQKRDLSEKISALKVEISDLKKSVKSTNLPSIQSQLTDKEQTKHPNIT